MYIFKINLLISKLRWSYCFIQALNDQNVLKFIVHRIGMLLPGVQFQEEASLLSAGQHSILHLQLFLQLDAEMDIRCKSPFIYLGFYFRLSELGRRRFYKYYRCKSLIG
jgi:hypothetical protein